VSETEKLKKDPNEPTTIINEEGAEEEEIKDPATEEQIIEKSEDNSCDIKFQDF